MAIRTALVPASEVLDLRWRVLRPGLPREAAVYAVDRAPAAFHVAAYDGDDPTVLACGTFFPEPLPAPAPAAAGPATAGAPAYRFRGMASAPEVRGRGYGTAVLHAGAAEAAARGARLLWCNGRTAARGFYEHHGFAAYGEEFEIEGIGPHLVFVRDLAEGGAGRRPGAVRR